ncbi:MAG: hypothetical protein GEU93_17475 [Propionibacteriales bacterium]|nr:hypothetical protein [Propionibacteriales bacterium]
MTRRGVRVGVRVLATAGALALVFATPGTAQADTVYDGEATALEVGDPFVLTLFPEDAELPPELAQLEDVRPQQIELSGAALPIPSRVGFATYEATDEPAALPDNPLLTGGGFRASSTNVNGNVVSEAVIGRLSLAGGALTAENIVARCTGDGEEITLGGPVGTLKGTEIPAGGSIELEPNTRTPIPGVGGITWNTQDTDGTTYGEVSNIVIDIDTNLSLDALQDLPEALAAGEGALKQVVDDLLAAGGGDMVPADTEDLTGQELYDALGQALPAVPTGERPDLNSLVRVSGSLMLANAACTQAEDEPTRPDEPENTPVGTTTPTTTAGPEPPLADTGASTAMTAAGAAGLLALLAGGYLALRARGRGQPH